MHILNRKEEIDQTKKYLLFDQYENREKSQLDADPHPSIGNIIVARQQQQQPRDDNKQNIAKGNGNNIGNGKRKFMQQQKILNLKGKPDE